MNYHVELAPQAQKEIKALPGYVRAPAWRIITSLGANPHPPKSKELRGKPGFYRLWLIAKWRIVYHIDDNEKLVTVLRVRRKENIDYDSL
jgi:mRNA-degrading endonuclease RelE of RelBE toxin-antitoxin system